MGRFAGALAVPVGWQPAAALSLPNSLQQDPLGLAGIVHELVFTWPHLAGVWDADGSYSVSVKKDTTINCGVYLAQSNSGFLTALGRWLALHKISTTLYVVASTHSTPGTGMYSGGELVHVLQVRHLPMSVHDSS